MSKRGMMLQPADMLSYNEPIVPPAGVNAVASASGAGSASGIYNGGSVHQHASAAGSLSSVATSSSVVNAKSIQQNIIIANAGLSYEDVLNDDFQFDMDGHDVMVFLHIQKTGGTSFGRHLVRDLDLKVRVCHWL